MSAFLSYLSKNIFDFVLTINEATAKIICKTNNANCNIAIVPIFKFLFFYLKNVSSYPHKVKNVLSSETNLIYILPIVFISLSSTWHDHKLVSL